jgi:hypothetical protein
MVHIFDCTCISERWRLDSCDICIDKVMFISNIFENTESLFILTDWEK